MYHQMKMHDLVTDAAEINGRITGRVTSTDNHYSLVSVAVWVSDQQIYPISQL